MIDALGGTLPGELVVLAQEGRQLERLEMMGQQDLRGVAHARPPDQQAHVARGRGRRRPGPCGR